MKTRLFPLLLALCLLFAGCSGSSDTPSSSDTLSANSSTGQQVAGPAVPNTVETQKVDVDLTKMNSTMVYAEVYNIVNSPENYRGKTIKIQGSYTSEVYEEGGKDYHFVLISDAMSCCQSGIEIVWKGEHKYPDDYPEMGANVEVVGVYTSYQDQGSTYYCLEVDDITTV